MVIKKFDVFLADLKPRHGTEPGKIRPVVVVQTDLLNTKHPSTIICPITTHVQKGVRILRAHLPKHASGLDHDSDALVDQVRAIDNKRFKKKIGHIPENIQLTLLENLRILVLE